MEAPEETNSLDPGGCSSFLRLMYRHGVPQPYQVLLSLLLVVHLPSWYTEILYYFLQNFGNHSFSSADTYAVIHS